MVSSQDGGGVIIFGGRYGSSSSSSSSTNKIWELRAGSSWTSGVWQEVGSLTNARYDHVVIPVPGSITNCQ